MKKDQIFKAPLKSIGIFSFNEDVAEVFDDMVSRSVPFYNEVNGIILDIVDKCYQKKSTIYDLGCSTGTTMEMLFKHLKEDCGVLYGCDNSQQMLDKCKQKLKSKRVTNFKLLCSEIESLEMKKCGLVIMNYTLQFIPIKKRMAVLKKIYSSLNKKGVFIYSEKIVSKSKVIDKLKTDLYYDFKRRNGYNELEISQKREALEKVLVPITVEKHLAMLKRAGFVNVELLFKWYNFACFIGIK